MGSCSIRYVFLVTELPNTTSFGIGLSSLDLEVGGERKVTRLELSEP